MIKPDEIVAELKRQTDRETVTEWCKRTGISRAHVYRVMNRVDPPADKICKALGFQRQTVTTYARARS